MDLNGDEDPDAQFAHRAKWKRRKVLEHSKGIVPSGTFRVLSGAFCYQKWQEEIRWHTVSFERRQRDSVAGYSASDLVEPVPWPNIPSPLGLCPQAYAQCLSARSTIKDHF